jgi:hypothetical protein
MSGVSMVNGHIDEPKKTEYEILTTRDRLIELIVNADTHDSYECKLCTKKDTSCTRCGAEKLANHLLANGVIVPPCKVGDTVWYELYGEIESAVVYSCVGVLKKQGFEITDANAKSSDGLEVAFNGKCIGKTVFLTKEEAEAKLKELKE